MDLRLLLQKYSVAESRSLLRHLDRKGILYVANDKQTLPYHARTMLHTDFLESLRQEGIPAPTQFFDIMKATGAVVSGWFVESFFEPDLIRLWRASHVGPEDVDLYVGRGKLEDTLTRMQHLPEVRTTVLETTSRQPLQVDDDAHVHPAHRNYIFSNPAINRMARISFEHADDETGYMNILESISISPIMPIATVDLTHLRCGISSEGYFDLHPNWSSEDKPFAGPQAISNAESGGASFYFQQKYEYRGNQIGTGGVIEKTKPHVCAESFDCPLTLRNTADDGVFFVPFTEEAAMIAKTRTPDTLCNPIVHWKHGGRCEQNGEDKAKPVLFDSNGISAEDADND